jgi:NADH:ubiquinone oxidoreductase subunit C
VTQDLQTAVAALLGIDPAAVKPEGMIISRDRHLDLATHLRQNGYTFYVTVCASHWPVAAATKTAPETPEHFQVTTILRNPARKGDTGASETFAWTVAVPADASIQSLVPLFAGADWQEREQWDLVGVRFSGHPDLRRLMMDEDWPGHPLRKDYAIETSHAPWR